MLSLGSLGLERCPRTVSVFSDVSVLSDVPGQPGALSSVPGKSGVLQGLPGHLGVLSGVPLHLETSSGVLGHSRVRVAGHKTFFFRATLGTQGG